MDRATAALRQEAVKKLRLAVGDKKPTGAQTVLLNTIAADLNRNTHRWGVGAGQSTLRLMLALRILEEDKN
jgi:hypothetical protein